MQPVRAWKIVLLSLAVATTATVAMRLRAPGFLEGGPPDMPGAWPVRALCHWDCWWYVDIAQKGYWYTPGTQSPVAYFPAFPMAVRAVAASGLSRFWAAVLVSALCGLFGVLVFQRWAQRLLPAHAATATWLLAVYPYAVYLYGVAYSDALFLLAAGLAFLALEDERPFAAAALGAIACLARPIAPAVVLGLLVRSVEKRRLQGGGLRLRDGVPALAGLGLLGWLAYQQLAFDDALAFIHVQSAPGWAQEPGPATWFKAAFFEAVFTRWRPGATARLLPQAVIAFGLLALVWPTRKRLGVGYAVYLLLVVGLPTLSTKDFMGLGRYALAGFPAWLTVAAWLDGRPRLRAAWLAVSLLFLLLAAAAFGTDVYLA